MIWLILSILSATGIFVTFKFIDKYNIPLINVIVINYIIAASLGFIINGSLPVNEIVHSRWIVPAMIIGFLFIVLFFVVGRSSQKAGISITTVASKMSVVIPMLFAIIAYNESVGAVKVIAITFAVFAVVMSVYVKPVQNRKSNIVAIILPLLLFLGMGLNNSLMIYSKENYVDAGMSSIFTSTSFAISLIFGVIIVFARPSTLKGFGHLKTWIFGLLLGVVNFGAVYFMFLVLNTGLFANSVTYGIVDVGIVALTVMIGTLFFKEKLSKLNIFGILLSIATIILLTVSEI